MASRNTSRSPPRPVSAHTSSAIPLSPAEQEKEALIAAACRERDLAALVQLATTSPGFVRDTARRAAWPLLLGCSEHDSHTTPWEKLPPHRDEQQVGLDVNRAFVYYPKHESEQQLQQRKEELSRVIIDVLRQHPSLCYFQGYHDIVQVFLLVLGIQDAPAAVARLSLLRIRDFMLSTLDPAISQLQLLRPIIRAADPDLYHHLAGSQPSFALADTITMFAHNIQDYKDITRLFDFFLAHDAVMPIYLFAAVLLSRRDEFLEIDQEDEDILYAMLGKLPQPFHVEFHIARTVELYERLSPASLGSWEWWKISPSSVLKSSSSIPQLHRLTLQDGERLFAQHEKDIRRQQALKRVGKNILFVRKRLWVYRKYGYLGLAVIVGAFAMWLGRRRRVTVHYALLGALSDLVTRFVGIST
ncbi:GTPase-activating protein gyp8 [Pleosporales sp. CAS-2024a]